MAGGTPSRSGFTEDTFEEVVFLAFAPNSDASRIEFFLRDGEWLEFHTPQLIEGSQLPPTPIVSSADGPVTQTFTTEVVSPKRYVGCGARENLTASSMPNLPYWTAANGISVLDGEIRRTATDTPQNTTSILSYPEDAA